MNRTYVLRSPRLLLRRLSGFLRLVGFTLAGSVLIWELLRLQQYFDPVEWTFIFILAIWLLLEGYWLVSPFLKRMFTPNNSENIVLFIPGNWFFNHHRMIRVILLGSTIIFTWILAVHIALDFKSSSSAFLLQLYVFSILIFNWMISECINHFGMASNWWWWSLFSLGAGSAQGYAFWIINRDPVFSSLIFVFCTGVATLMFIAQRVDVSERVWSEVLSDINMQLLVDYDGHYDWQQVISLIHDRLRYERVSILVPSDEHTLVVAAECGLSRAAQGQKISIGEGITGRAFLSGKICAWNDTRECSYYKRLDDQEQDQTRAEIAVPITHQGEPFGILDVQSRTPMVYDSGDIHSLDNIGRILGTALSNQKTRELLDNTLDLWDKLFESNESETELFDSVAGFFQQRLGADIVTIYSLSPTGYPAEPPKIYGRLHYPDDMQEPVFDPKSPLFQLISEWKFSYEKGVTPSSVFFNMNPLKTEGFTGRENIRSVAFIPIGTSEERLAVLFLNFRNPRGFPDLFKLMVQGLSQTIAMFLERKRYQRFLFEGLGRPEYGIHTIIGHYGFKDGVFPEATNLFKQGCVHTPETLADCGLHTLLERMDHFILQVRAQKSKDISTRMGTLKEAIDLMTNQMKELTTYDSPVRFIKVIDPIVDRETSWTKLALFRLIDEAVNNAIYHGHATEITIQVERKELGINTLISNNGVAFPFGAEKHKSAGGIYSIEKEIEEIFHAHVQVGACPDGTGTMVKAEIPALPVKIEEVLS